MDKKLRLKILKIVKSVVQWATIISGVIIAIKVIVDALNPKTSTTVEDAKEVIEITKLKIDVIEIKKKQIEEEHQQILDDKKERDRKAKEFFSNL